MKNGHTVETDVLVLGAGGAGLAAAVSAAEKGARVIVSEKCGSPGGTTALSIGSVTAGRTVYQTRRGIVDSQEAFFEDIQAFNEDLDIYDNKDLCWVLVREAGNTIEWMRSLGFEFFGPSLEPPHRVPRMHNVIPNAWAYPLLLQRAAAKKGVKFLFNARGRTLIREGGRIVGAVIEKSKEDIDVQVLARKAVILACGDFSANEVLKRRYLSPDMVTIPAYNPYSEGDGHVMGAEVGARLVNMEILKKAQVRFIPAQRKLWNELLPTHPFLVKLYAIGSRLLPQAAFTGLAKRAVTTRGAPDIRLYKEGAILINNRGERFTNEMNDASVAIAQQPRGQAYIVFDSRLAKKFSSWPYFVSTAAGIAYAYLQDYERDVSEVVSKGNTIEQAAKSHPAPEALILTVKRYNNFVKGGRDEDFERASLGDGILEPPFYIMGPVESYMGVPRGGLDINTSFHVLDQSGEIIPGLYSAGRSAGGLILNGHGLNLSWAFTSGRLAGIVAAEQEKMEPKVT